MVREDSPARGLSLRLSTHSNRQCLRTRWFERHARHELRHAARERRRHPAHRRRNDTRRRMARAAPLATRQEPWNGMGTPRRRHSHPALHAARHLPRTNRQRQPRQGIPLRRHERNSLHISQPRRCHDSLSQHGRRRATAGPRRRNIPDGSAPHIRRLHKRQPYSPLQQPAQADGGRNGKHALRRHLHPHARKRRGSPRPHH